MRGKKRCGGRCWGSAVPRNVILSSLKGLWSKNTVLEALLQAILGLIL